MALKPLNRYQAQTIALATERLNIWEGSVRSSKTTCANLAWIRFVLSISQDADADDSPLLMVGKTERTLKRNVIDPMTRMLGVKRCRFVAGLGELRLMGRTVYVAGANDERSADRIHGLTLRGAYVDEGSLIPESFFKMLMSRLSMDDSRLFATSNPDSSNHWLLKQYLKKAKRHLTAKGPQSVSASPLDLVRFSFRLSDNPHLPRHYVEALAKEYTGLWRLRYIDGLWVIAEGAIYPMWDDHLVVPWEAGGGIIVIGIDYGTTNPFSAVALEIGSERIHAFRQLRIEDPLTDSELSAALKKWMGEEQINPKWLCVDPSAASFKRQLYRDKHRNVVDADNDVGDGIRMVSSLFSAQRLVIDPCCESLLEEIPGYRWDPEASLKGIDKPIKKDDHDVDGLRYAVATTENIWRHLITMPAAA